MYDFIRNRRGPVFATLNSLEGSSSSDSSSGSNGSDPSQATAFEEQMNSMQSQDEMQGEKDKTLASIFKALIQDIGS